jgi:hypothetical protein
MKQKIFLLVLFLLFSNLILSQTTTWTGTWDNGTPDNTKEVIFSADFTATSAIEAKSIVINNNAKVIFSGNVLTVTDNINIASSAHLIFENSGSLVQINPSIINTDAIEYNRNSTAMRQFEYTYWGSPVSNQTLVGFSPLTASDRYYSFNADSNVNNYVTENPNNTMLPAVGYAIRAPENYTSTAQIFNGKFIGTPNNGNITTNVIAFIPSKLNYNLLSNPYPSAISVASLIDNTTLGALYLWTHNTAINNNVFSVNDYAIRTKNTGIAAISGGAIPGEYLAAAQGFFASSSATGNIVFTNAMRVGNNNSQFFKISNKAPQYYYFRINVTNSGGAFKQIALGYEEGATNGYDFLQDALATPGEPIKFYSLIGTDGFAIQGRAFPWTVNDEIALGYTSTIMENYEITLNDTDVLFPTQDIYINDMNSGTFHNLKTGPYTFSTEIGTFNNRFKIVYTVPTLSKEDFFNNLNTVFLQSKNNEIEIKSTDDKIKSVKIHTVLGQTLFSQPDINRNLITVSNIGKQNQILIVKAQLENGQIVSKKIIF